MTDHNFSSSADQHDPKEFRESFGSFGTTTQPGANQLTELQTKVRQGVKHVELHLAGRGKGNFGQQDVPDKYGFEQRRTIMQLAKLNNQTLSVHSSFDIVSFSGLGQGGFNEADRANNIREIDESIKFAAETAKQGAVVFHIQGDPLPSSRGDLNLSKEYLDWLKENNISEYERLQKEYFLSNPLDREFVDNVEQIKEIKIDYENLKQEDKDYYVQEASKNKTEAWKEYFSEKSLEKAKVSPDYNPMVVIGDKIATTPRQQEMVDFKSLKSLDSKDRDIIKQIGVDLSQTITIEDYQKLNAIFTNGKPQDLDVSKEEFRNLKNKVLLDYTKIYKENNFMSGISDQVFYQQLIDNQIELAKLQKEDIEFNNKLYGDEAEQIKTYARQEREIISQLEDANNKGDLKRVEELKVTLNGGLTSEQEQEFNTIVQKAQQSGGQLSQQDQQRAQELQQFSQGTNGIKYQKQIIMQKIGQLEYQKLEKYDEIIAQTNEQVNKLEEQRNEIKSITDESFKKNTTAIAHLGTKALRYQLDLKQKSKDALEKKAEINKRVAQLQKEYESEHDVAKQNKLHTELQKERYKLKSITGMKDYEDIDLINKPLYLAPENMLPGYGSLTSIEEFKATVRMSQQEFAKKLLSDEAEYKKLREEYESETGLKIVTQQDAFQVAKNHIGGTFDNAHAAVWLKHFKKENGESEEHRIDRFNTWLNDQAVDMYKEGIIKHVHFNDTAGKDDDHNLLGQGILDIHDLRERLRGAGFKEALIVEAGGRGAQSIMHLQNAWDIFNPSLFADENSRGGTGYKLQNNNSQFVGGQQVSDWMTIRREYENRPEYSQYGFGYNAFKPRQPQQGQQRGSWSGMGFL
jgi:sugar phosphate isomerase/epimerase